MKLSIITVCYNNLDGLVKTVESVKSQSFSDYEYIVIDGGSTDGSAEYIRLNSSLFAYSVSEKDKGIYDAMNKGIKAAKGEYCLFLNSGDYLASGSVFEGVFNEDVNYGIIYGDVVKTKGKLKRRLKYKDNLSVNDFFSVAPAIHHQAALIRRSLFEEIGMYRTDTFLVSDWIMFFTAFCKGISMKHVDKVFSVCDMNGASNSYDMNNPRIQYDETVRKQMILDYCSHNKIENTDSQECFFANYLVKFKWRWSRFVSLEHYVK